jgi:hypothetical protein
MSEIAPYSAGAGHQREQNSPSSRLRLRSSIRRRNRPLRRFAVRWGSPRRRFIAGTNCMAGSSHPRLKNAATRKENSRLRKVVARITTRRPEPAPLRKRIARSPRGGYATAIGASACCCGVNYRLGRLDFFAHPALLEESPDELHGELNGDDD